MNPQESFGDIWELAERAVREARVLRSFLEYLRLEGDSVEIKWKKVQNWRTEVGLQLGNPQVTDSASQLFETLKVLPEELRRAAVRRTLQEADSLYFEKNGSST
jgi:hypothetical protein